MTRSELKTLMRSWLDDTSGGYFTDSQCNTWLNLAQRRVQMVLLQAGENFYEKTVETLTVASQADYVLPSDFFILHRLEIVASGSGTSESRQPIYPITINQQDLVSIALGTPANYYLKKDRFTLSPTPDTANKVLRLYYSYLVADMSADGDEPDVPEQYHELVAIYAAEDGFIKDDRTMNNLIFKKEKYEALIKQAAENRTQDRSRQVVMVEDYDVGNWI